MREAPHFWYARNSFGALLAPMGWLVGLFTIVRRAAYRYGIRRSWRIGCPVVIVGNLSVGGTGKTPLVIAIAKLLAARGVRVGVICRGYRGTGSRWPRKVRPDSDPGRVGDEAVLLARRTGVPVAAGPNRIAAGRILFRRAKCDVILSDDGLQHLRLARDVEIVVIDAERRHGNGRCLPVGPLREPLGRLASVDLVVANGPAAPGEFEMRLEPGPAVNLADPGLVRPLGAFRGEAVHAVCAIGHQERFFRTLESHGLTIVRHPFPDHHPFREEEVRFSDDTPVLMTEKDAVKCERFADARHWCVPVDAVLSNALQDRLLAIVHGLGVVLDPDTQSSVA